VDAGFFVEGGVCGGGGVGGLSGLLLMVGGGQGRRRGGGHGRFFGVWEIPHHGVWCWMFGIAVVGACVLRCFVFSLSTRVTLPCVGGLAEVSSSLVQPLRQDPSVVQTQSTPRRRRGRVKQNMKQMKQMNSEDEDEDEDMPARGKKDASGQVTTGHVTASATQSSRPAMDRRE